MSKKYHIGKNGPAECKATVRTCRYGQLNDGSHYDTFEEAQKNYEKQMNEHTLPRMNKKQELSPEILHLRQLMTNTENSIQNFQELGKAYEKILADKLGFDPINDELTDQQFKQIETANQKLFQEICETGNTSALQVEGKYANSLLEAIKFLPNGAFPPQRIFTKPSRKNGKYAGYFCNGIDVERPAETVIPSNDYYSSFKKGDYVLDYFNQYTDVENGTNSRIYKIVSNDKIVNITPFLKSLSYQDRSFSEPKAFIEMMRKKYVDSDGNVNQEEFENLLNDYPQLKKHIGDQKQVIVEEYWVGAIPRQKGLKYQKVDNEVELQKKGRSVVVKKPLYKILEKKTDYAANTIAVSGLSEENMRRSILLHEYSHSLQNFSGRTEEELFKQISSEGNKRYSKTYEEEVYDNFPDPYMGVARGNELLTRSTESFFYPSCHNESLFGSKRGQNADPIRQWVIGFWLNKNNVKH